MSVYITEHFCSVEDTRKITKPRLAPTATWCEKFNRIAKTITIISAKNPQTTKYFSSSIKLKGEMERQLACKYCIIHPLSLFTMYWQFFMCFVFYINVTIGLAVPMFQIFIRVSKKTFQPLIYVYETTNFICLLDILVNFLTGYINKETHQCVLDRRMIAARYASTFFVVDILAFDIILSFLTYIPRLILIHHIILGTWKLIRIIRLKTANKHLEKLTKFIKLPPEYFGVMQIIVRGCFLAHVNAMAYVCIPAVTMREKTWMAQLCNSYKKESKHMFANVTCTEITGDVLYYYIQHSYAETLTRICLVYWGKVSPETWEDSWLTIISLFCGFCFNIYFIVFLKTIMETGYFASLHYEENALAMKGFCVKHMLPDELEKKLLRNFEEIFRGEYYNKKKFDEFTSDILKGDLFAEHKRNQAMIDKSRMFSGVTRTAYIAIIKSLKRAVYFPGDVIESIGSRKKGMYFIATGSVAIYDSDGKELYHLEEGDHFGVHTIYARSINWNYTVIAIEVSEIYRLSKRDYERKIQEHDWTFLERLSSTSVHNRRSTVAEIAPETIQLTRK